MDGWRSLRGFLVSLLEIIKKQVPHPSVRRGGDGGLACCRQCLARNCFDVPVCGNDTNRKTQPRVAYFIAAHPPNIMESRGTHLVGPSAKNKVKAGAPGKYAFAAWTSLKSTLILRNQPPSTNLVESDLSNGAKGGAPGACRFSLLTVGVRETKLIGCWRGAGSRPWPSQNKTSLRLREVSALLDISRAALEWPLLQAERRRS